MTSTAMTAPVQGGNGAVVQQYVPPMMTPEREFAQLMELAKSLVQTGFLPKAVNTPAKAATIILTGREMGIPPMQALRLIHVIDGKPTLAAELQLAMFLRHGGKTRIIASDNEKCVIAFSHPNGSPEHTETFAMADATRMGLTGKDNWRKHPKAMLRARCISAGLRVVAPDMVSGVYDPDEMGAVTDADGSIEALPEPAATEAESEAEAVVREPETMTEVNQWPMTLERARVLTIPLGHGKSKVMGSIPPRQLTEVLKWAEGKLATDPDNISFNNIHDAAVLLLEHQEEHPSVASSTDSPSERGVEVHNADDAPPFSGAVDDIKPSLALQPLIEEVTVLLTNEALSRDSYRHYSTQLDTGKLDTKAKLEGAIKSMRTEIKFAAKKQPA